MSAVIVIEILAGIAILAGAVWYAVRDTKQREASREPEVGSAGTAQAPARSSEPEAEAAQSLSEVGSTESS